MQQQELIHRVAGELESIRCLSNDDNITGKQRGYYNDIGVKFPDSCLQLLQAVPGNQYCVDCGGPNPTWASITYGVVMCLQCSGTHRSYGVQVSYVRSIEYDTWNHTQLVSLLEGGNTQLRTFFQRHQLLNTDKNNQSSSTVQQQLYNQRYHTKAAQFYKIHLKQHVQTVEQNGVYRGREHNRNQSLPSQNVNSCHRSKSPTTVAVVHDHHPTITTTNVKNNHTRISHPTDHYCGKSLSVPSSFAMNNNGTATEVNST